MYTLAGIGLMAIIMAMVIPVNFETVQNDEITFYGVADLIVRDGDGNAVFLQSIHNRLVNDGEEFILDQIFHTGVTEANDDVSIGALCASDDVSTLGEGSAASAFDTANNINDAATTNCVEATDVDVSANDGTAVFSVTFTGGVNVDSTEIIDGIGVCNANTTNDNDFVDCAGGGGVAILFAFVDTSNVALSSVGPETVDVTYTFDISSSGT